MRITTLCILGSILAFTSFPGQLRGQDVSLASLPRLQVGSVIPGRASVPNDINGDGLSEILLYSPSSSKLQIWSISLSADQASLHKAVLRTIPVTPGYFVAATGDLDGDGKTDLVFTSSSRDLYLWKSVGDGSFVSSYRGTYPSGWTLIGSADIDGDGTDDLLWENASTCQFGDWLYKKGVRTSFATHPFDCGDRPVAIGYYSLSKRASVVWSDTSHNLIVWDSVDGGFSSDPLGNYPSDEFVYSLGGGEQGGDMYLMTATSDNSSYSDRHFSRNFSIAGTQTSWTRGTFGSGGKLTTEYSGGFMVRAQGINRTGLVTFNQQSYTFSLQPSLLVCVPSANPYDSYSLTPGMTCQEFQVATGWIPLGTAAAAAG